MTTTGSSTTHHHHRHLAFIPWPGRGHINPMLNLSRSLSSKSEHIRITFIVTEEWLTILSSSSFPPNLRLVSIPNVLASEHSRGTDILSFIHTVFTQMGGPVEKLLIEQVDDHSLDLIFADVLLPWVPGIASKIHVPVVSVFTMSVSLFLQAHLELDDEETIQEKSSSSSPPYLETIQKFRESMSRSEKSKSLIFTSIYELENQAIDTLKSKLQIPIYCLGCVIPSIILNDNTSNHHKWLDSKPSNSVLYVSLGSFMPISRAQLDEMVHGLNASGVFFFLVVRGEEFQRAAELCENTGFVVQWCDQFSVLCHDSVGGFLTHCGWNSTLEGIYSGVPMLTFPLAWDQLLNSKLIVDKWKVGLRLKVEGKEGEIVGREEIARIACELMGSDGEKGKELRRRAGELSENCRKAFGDGGSCSSGFDAFVHDVLIKPSIDEQKL